MSIFKVELEKRKKNLNVETGEKDLMDGLMRQKNEEGKQLSEVEVLDNMVSLVVGGYESTTLSIMWALFYLAKYPPVLKKVREENVLVRKNFEGDMITNYEISKLKYTNKVVEEIIRLANISAFVFRIVHKDVEHKGYKIPKGWKVICWLRYLHENPENFEDPLTFNPDRWDEKPKSGTFFAFGAGKRVCAGNMLARLQVAIFLHHLVVGYRWELVNPNAKMSYLPNPKPVDGVEIAITKI
ncbi:hypothetical protein ACH5RR_007639 [Cinchona calisaya]|uniref:Ent-kaurenoic acid oxidase n=1 Tax=Cinchona calisaya TaxID=153742 RepID=A0ABD3ACV7_9GENT